MTMKLEISDSHSNHSDFSYDSQSSQSSYNEPSRAPASRPAISLASFEGLNSGVPTLTTGTITQTQLRNFEQTYIELSNFRTEQASHAGFVPPSLTNSSYSNLNTIGYSEQGPMTALHVSPGPLSASGDSSSSPGLPAPRRRNMGGRRPARPPQDTTPEEEERRSVRRERNKMAAARCRKRRLDRTNELQDETDVLEAKRQELQDQYRKLQDEREQLDAILQNHLASCALGKRSLSPPDVKPFECGFVYGDDGVRVKVEPVEHFGDPTVDPNVLVLDHDMFHSPITDKRLMLPTNPVVSECSLATPPAHPARRPRPTSLHVPLPAPPPHKYATSIAGIEITTPSNGAFNFDSLMEGGTGLTPVHPHPHPCSIQQRANPEVSSPNNSLVSL